MAKRNLESYPDISELESHTDSSVCNPSGKKTGLRPRFYDRSVGEVGESGGFGTKPADNNEVLQHCDTNLDEQVDYSPSEGEGEESELEVRPKSQHEVVGQNQQMHYGSVHSPTHVSPDTKAHHNNTSSLRQHLHGKELPSEISLVTQPLGDVSVTAKKSKSPTESVIQSDRLSLASHDSNPQLHHSSRDHSENDSSQKKIAKNLSQRRPRRSSRVRFQDLGGNNLHDNVHQENGHELNDSSGNNPNNPLLNNHQQAPSATQSLNWKTFIYYSLCLPESDTAKCCKCRYILALALHLLIFVQGIAFILISVISIADDDDSVGNHPLLPAKTISCLIGIFFVLIFLYWLLVSSCTFARGCPNPPRDYNFYFLSVIWFLLVLFGTGLLFTMLIQTIDNRENIEYYFTCRRNASIPVYEPNQKHCLNFIIVWSLALIVFYLLYCIAVFCWIVVKTIVGFCRH